MITFKLVSETHLSGYGKVNHVLPRIRHVADDTQAALQIASQAVIFQWLQL